MHLTAIVAMDRKGLIGAGGKIPWHLPSDLRRFRRLTMGRPCIMGRKTWESLPCPLEGRTNIVMTSYPGFIPDDCVSAMGYAKAAGKTGQEGYEAFVIGGAKVYKTFLPKCRRICLTIVDGDFDGDTYFPVHLLDGRLWRCVGKEGGPVTAEGILEGKLSPAEDHGSNFYELIEKKQPGEHHREIGHWIDRDAYREATGL